MKTNHLILGLAPALALAACGGNRTDNTTIANATMDNMSGMAMPGDANSADNAALTEAGLSPAQRFANHVSASDHFEIEAGRIAQQKAQAKALKDFAGLMVEQHTASLEKLRAAGAAANPAITPDPTLTAEQEADLMALRTLGGPAFDDAYKVQQITAHEKALAAIKSYAETGDSADLKAFATATERVVEAHLARIKNL